MKLLSRAEAVIIGSKTYFTGRPCKMGHVSDRYTSNKKCCDCSKIWNRSERQREYNKWYKQEFKDERRMKDSMNREQINAREKAWKEKNKELHRETSRAWRIRNSDKIRKRKRDRYERDRAHILSLSHKWRRENPLKLKAAKHNGYIRRKKRVAMGVSTQELHDWMKSQKKVCYWCFDRCEDLFHVDHYIPLAKGGAHEIDNFVISCPFCNVKKNARDPYEFAQERGRLF